MKIRYLFYCILTIALGLLSRQFDQVPSWVGDLMYAVLIYWIWRFFLTRSSKSLSLILSISFCFFIEFMQLIDIPLLQDLRKHKFLKLILGTGFLWTDLIAYIIGAILAWRIDARTRV